MIALLRPCYYEFDARELPIHSFIYIMLKWTSAHMQPQGNLIITATTTFVCRPLSHSAHNETTVTNMLVS